MLEKLLEVAWIHGLGQPFVQKGHLLPCGASSETSIVGQRGTEMAD